MGQDTMTITVSADNGQYTDSTNPPGGRPGNANLSIVRFVVRFGAQRSAAHLRAAQPRARLAENATATYNAAAQLLGG